MENKIMIGAITATIVIIIVATALIPVIDDASATHDVFINTGLYKMDKIETSENIIIEWDHTVPASVEINDQIVNLPSKNGDWTIMGASNFFVRMYISSNDTLITAFTSSGSVNASLNAAQDITITLSDGVFTATVSGGSPLTQSTDSDYVYVITDDEKAGYVMKDPNIPAYILDDSQIQSIIIGRTTATGISCCLFFEYVPGDEVVIHQFYGTPATFDNFAVVSDYDDDYVNLIDLDRFTFRITQGDSSIDATYSYFIVPHEVTAERSTHATPGQAALYKAIPVLVFVALLVGVIGYGIYRSRD